MQGSSRNGTRMRNYPSLGKAARAYKPGTTGAETDTPTGERQPGLGTKHCHRERKGRGKKEGAQRQAGGGWVGRGS